MHVTLYHNPRCSKSREALNLLKEHNVSMKVVEYLKDPLTFLEIKKLLEMLNMHPRELMRENEKPFTSQNLSNPSLTVDDLIEALTKDPILLQRPIISDGQHALLARPIEKLLDFLNLN